MTSDQSWKEKYLQELESAEQRQKQREAEKNALQRMLVRTSLASEGQAAELDPPANDGAWQNWRATVRFPVAGYYEIWARATDSEGEMQRFAIDWNPKGYLNNRMHRVGLRVS